MHAYLRMYQKFKCEAYDKLSHGSKHDDTNTFTSRNITLRVHTRQRCCPPVVKIEIQESITRSELQMNISTSAVQRKSRTTKPTLRSCSTLTLSMRVRALKTSNLAPFATTHASVIKACTRLFRRPSSSASGSNATFVA